jgi:hypothetical protein
MDVKENQKAREKALADACDPLSESDMAELTGMLNKVWVIDPTWSPLERTPIKSRPLGPNDMRDYGPS